MIARRHFDMTLRRSIASVAPMKSSRFLPGSVLVQVQPGHSRSETRGRGRLARHFVANEDQAGSNPVVRSNNCPRSTTVVWRFRKPPASVRFRPRARRRRCSRSEGSRPVRGVMRVRLLSPARGDHSSVAKRHCARLLTEEVQVRVLPLELVRVRPTGEAAAFQAAPGEFDSRRPLRCARSSAVERRPDVPEIVGSIPAARTNVVFFQWPRNPVSHSGNTGSIPVHDTRFHDSVF